MDEYIKKEAAMTVPVLPKEHREYQTFNLDDAYEQGWNDALENLVNVPTADVAPVRHGRWEFKDDDGAYPWTTKAICSECKKVIAWNARLSLKNNQIEFAHENHYCLNCGAIMDGVKV